MRSGFGVMQIDCSALFYAAVRNPTEYPFLFRFLFFVILYLSWGFFAVDLEEMG